MVSRTSKAIAQFEMICDPSRGGLPEETTVLKVRCLMLIA